MRMLHLSRLLVVSLIHLIALAATCGGFVAFPSLIRYTASMARRRLSKEARNNALPRCTGVRVSVLDGDLLAVTILTGGSGRQRNRWKPVIVDRRHAQHLVNVFRKFSDEVPNRQLKAAIRAAERHKMSGNMKGYGSIRELMDSLK